MKKNALGVCFILFCFIAFPQLFAASDIVVLRIDSATATSVQNISQSNNLIQNASIA